VQTDLDLIGRVEAAKTPTATTYNWTAVARAGERPSGVSRTREGVGRRL